MFVTGDLIDILADVTDVITNEKLSSSARGKR